MAKKNWTLTLLTGLLGIFIISGFSGQASANKPAATNSALKTEIREAYGKLPLAFIKNDGQLNQCVKFYENSSGHTTFFTKEGVSLLLTKTEKPASNPKHPAGSFKFKDAKVEIKSQLIKLIPLGANKTSEIIAENKLKSKINYLVGGDKKKWRTGIPAYKVVRYQEIYPGIDLKFYGNNQQLEYDFVVKPGADPSKIKLSYEGVGGLKVTDTGKLEIVLKECSIFQNKPYIYQLIAGKRQEVEGKFILMPADKQGKPLCYAFEITPYNKNYPLIIDPVLVYSTYLGGSGREQAFDVAVDSAGNAYVTGFTSSLNFPVTPAVYQSVNTGGNDVFVSKLNAAGDGLVYSTYLGGKGSDRNYGIAIDDTGNAYVAGYTNSTDFPTTAGAYQTVFQGIDDVFITKINASGNALLYSTYLGGSGREQCLDVAVDSAGNTYVTGYTLSADFPATAGAYQTVANGNQELFITKLNAAGSGLVYSTYLGGASNDVALSIALDNTGNAYVAGYTSSSDFPTVTGAYQGGFSGGNYDVFVSKINSTGSGLVYSTYLGGSSDDVGNHLVVDSAGNTYVTGYTLSADFPTTVGAYQTNIGGSYDAFITKINPSGNGLTYSTFLGGSAFDYGNAIAVDSAGNSYVTGETASANFPTEGQPLQGSFAGGICDIFLSELTPSGAGLLHSTYLGGYAGDHGFALALDSVGNSYIVGRTGSVNFPTVSAAQGIFGGNDRDAFVSKIEKAVTSPLIEQTLNQTGFITTETLNLTITVTATPAPTIADVYVRVVLPDGSMLYLDALSSTPAPVVSSWTVTDYGPALYFSYTFDGSEPSGNYQFEAYFTEPGTTNIIGTKDIAPFTFTP